MNKILVAIFFALAKGYQQQHKLYKIL